MVQRPSPWACIAFGMHCIPTILEKYAKILYPVGMHCIRTHEVPQYHPARWNVRRRRIVQFVSSFTGSGLLPDHHIFSPVGAPGPPWEPAAESQRSLRAWAQHTRL